MKIRLRTLYKRSIVLFSVFCLLTAALLSRIAFLQSGELSAVARGQLTKRVKLGATRGYIYDVKHRPLVNSAKNEKTVFLSCPRNNGILNKKLPHQKICSGICITSDCEKKYAESNFLKNYLTVERYADDKLCPHIIGYLDSRGKGASGIEKAFDRLLKNAGGELFVNFEADAKGNALPGGGIKMENNNYDSPAGIVLTIDKDIQLIAENALENSSLKRGAAVVMDVNTFRIAASASVPAFDAENLAQSLKGDDLPFINRAFSAYPVGSVFKPFVAAAAIENGWDCSEKFDCTGSVRVGDNTFGCYNMKAHGIQNLNDAVEHSCNTFFIELGLRTGAEKLISSASLFGFGKKTEMCPYIVSAAGNLPCSDCITSRAQLANICFGQGELLATPVQLAAAYSVIANGGNYIEPSLLSELINSDGEVYGYYNPELSYRAAEERTCAILRESLHNNMLNGTGKKGQPENVSAAGKTATAQTGTKKENGGERLCTWFAGFFPSEAPVFAVVIFNEDGSAASVDCAPVFKEIAEKIVSLFKGTQKAALSK